MLFIFCQWNVPPSATIQWLIISILGNNWQIVSNFTFFSYLMNLVCLGFNLLILFNNDVEINAVSNRWLKKALSTWYWTLNSISADNFAKFNLLKAFAIFYRFGIFKLYFNNEWMYLGKQYQFLSVSDAASRYRMWYFQFYFVGKNWIYC